MFHLRKKMMRWWRKYKVQLLLSLYLFIAAFVVYSFYYDLNALGLMGISLLFVLIWLVRIDVIK